MTEKPHKYTGLPDASGPPARPTLADLALLFLRLGATVFGGPAAHIAVMEDEVGAPLLLVDFLFWTCSAPPILFPGRIDGDGEAGGGKPPLRAGGKPPLRAGGKPPLRAGGSPLLTSDEERSYCAPPKNRRWRRQLGR